MPLLDHMHLAATVSAIANPFKHRLIHNNPTAKHSIAILVDITFKSVSSF